MAVRCGMLWHPFCPLGDGTRCGPRSPQEVGVFLCLCPFGWMIVNAGSAPLVGRRGGQGDNVVHLSEEGRTDTADTRVRYRQWRVVESRPVVDVASRHSGPLRTQESPDVSHPTSGQGIGRSGWAGSVGYPEASSSSSTNDRAPIISASCAPNTVWFPHSSQGYRVASGSQQSRVQSRQVVQKPVYDSSAQRKSASVTMVVVVIGLGLSWLVGEWVAEYRAQFLSIGIAGDIVVPFAADKLSALKRGRIGHRHCQGVGTLLTYRDTVLWRVRLPLYGSAFRGRTQTYKRNPSPPPPKPELWKWR